MVVLYNFRCVHSYLKGQNFGPHKIDIRVVKRSKGGMRVMGMRFCMFKGGGGVESTKSSSM